MAENAPTRNFGLLDWYTAPYDLPKKTPQTFVHEGWGRGSPSLAPGLLCSNSIDYCRERSERPYMKEHLDITVPRSFVDENLGSKYSEFSRKFQESLFFLVYI